MSEGQVCKVALLGLMLESNRFAPVTTEDDFLDGVYLAGNEILEDLSSADPSAPTELRGFAAAMTQTCDWLPVPILVGHLMEAGGPLDHDFFEATCAEMRRRLIAAMPVDAVYICNHGAMVTTRDLDPDGTIFAMVREIVGPDVPVVATLDLHGNVSERMVEAADAIVAYRTNPHVDMFDRGREAAAALVELLDGLRPEVAFTRLPITPPTVTLLTGQGPYGELLDFGQSFVGADILNVSVLGGFVYSDTPKNGLSVVVTARSRNGAAAAAARQIADRAWEGHRHYLPRLTPLDEAVARAVATCDDPALPPVILADVADNPGGGGMGNTTWILEALHKARATGVVIGVVWDPDLAAEAARLGEGAEFEAVFNRAPADAFSRRFSVHARVERLHDGDCVGRRGLYARRRMNLGQTALLAIGGIRVAVTSVRAQCADPVFLEMLGVDIASARAVVVKSRGHFRAGFDEFFADDQVIEVDAPGLTSPVLSRFDFQSLPRPVFPVDEKVPWPAPA